MLTELVFKQVEEAGVICHVSDPVQVTGDFGLQLKFIASKMIFTSCIAWTVLITILPILAVIQKLT